MKNPNGYGCVVDLGKNRRKRYAIRVTREWRDGKQIYDYLAYFADKKEAIRALASNNVTPITPKSKITFAELYAEWKPLWFRSISAKLQGNYENGFKHFASLHEVKFADIRTAHLQKIIDDLDRSYSTKHKMKVLAGLLFKYAIENDICVKNYAEFIKLDKKPKQGKNKAIFTDLEIETLFKNDDLPYVDVILVLIHTGFRINELFSLTKFAVDLKNMTIVGGLKTEAGENRTVPINPKIYKYIKKWYDNATDWLVLSGSKKMTYNYFITNHYYNILDRFSIPRKTPHTTRHTAATLMARAGMDPLAIQLIMGHSTYAFTADTYTHTDVDYLKKEMLKL